MSDTRAAEIGAIHVAKKQLAMDDYTYRLMLHELTGKESSALLDQAERRRVLDALRRKGFMRTPPKRAGRARLADSQQAKMARGLWIELHKAGAVKDPSERALDHFCKRITGVDSLAFAGPADLNLVIEALKDWTERHARKRAPATRT